MQVFISLFIAGLYILNLGLIAYIMFKDRHSTTPQKWAWILVLLFIPIVGIFLYILCGRDLSTKKIFNLQSDAKEMLIEEVSSQKIALEQGTFKMPDIEMEGLDQLIAMMTQSGGSIYERNNQVKLFIDGIEKFNHVVTDIEQAKSYIHIEYFCYEMDDLGSAIRDKLYEACQRGVKVKILLDGWGSIAMRKKFFQKLIDLGAEVDFFMPYIMQANYRNHRKIIVVDGHIGYIGGFNIADEYLGLRKKMGYWRDNHLRIEGPAVHDLQRRFLIDWNAEKRHDEPFLPEYFPMIKGSGHTDIQIISSGPDSQREQIKMVYLKMIAMAKKEILIQTPYYIPDESLHEGIKAALLSGVDVTIQIPNKPDHILVYWATYSLVAELLRYGANIQIYDNGFIHAKTLIVDGKVASVGSANFDERSLHLNFEINAVLYDESFVKHLRNTFMETNTQCFQLTQELYEQRSAKIKIKESLARLVSPIL